MVKAIMNRREMVKFLIMRSLGNFLVLLSVYGIFMTFGPALYYEVVFRVAQARGITYEIAEVLPQPSPDPVNPVIPTPAQTIVEPGFQSVISSSTVQVLQPPDTTFSIIIPKIGASARVVPNVDPANDEEFRAALLEGVAHAKGTLFPGMGQGNVYLFAHSTDNWWNVGRYNAIFYLLKDLTQGDEVVVFFENRRYNYVVTESFVADSDEVSYLVNAQKGDETLIMQTCWPPGTTWKRLFVKAKPKASLQSYNYPTDSFGLMRLY